MKGDILVLGHLIDAMSDAAAKLESAQKGNKIEEFNKIKAEMLALQKEVDKELSKKLI